MSEKKYILKKNDKEFVSTTDLDMALRAYQSACEKIGDNLNEENLGANSVELLLEPENLKMKITMEVGFIHPPEDTQKEDPVLEGE